MGEAPIQNTEKLKIEKRSLKPSEMMDISKEPNPSTSTSTSSTDLPEAKSIKLEAQPMASSSTASPLATALVEDKLQDSEKTSEEQPEKKVKRKCFTCKKKLGLLGFNCRCKNIFCSLHRYSDKHDCNFDYKTLGAEEIRKNNKLIVAQKV